MSDLSMGVDWTKIVFGDRARHVAGRIVLIDMGPASDGQHIWTVGGYFVGEAGHPGIDPCGMQVVVGDFVIRPQREATGRDFVGMGMNGCITGTALDPDDWGRQL